MKDHQYSDDELNNATDAQVVVSDYPPMQEDKTSEIMADSSKTADQPQAPIAHPQTHQPIGAGINTPLVISESPKPRRHVGKIVVAAVLILALILVVAGWAINYVATNTFDQKIKESVAQSTNLSPNDIQVSVEGGPRLLQVITGRYERISFSIDKPFNLANLPGSGAADQSNFTIQHTKVDMEGVDAGTGVADRITATCFIDADQINQSLGELIQISDQNIFTNIDLHIIDGGVHFESKLAGEESPISMVVDFALSIDDSGRLVVDPVRGEFQGYGQTHELSKPELMMFGQEIEPIELASPLPEIRPTRLDITTDGMTIEYSGVHVKIDQP